MVRSLQLANQIRFECVLRDCARSADMVGLFNRIYDYDLKAPVEALLEDGGYLDRLERISTLQEDRRVDDFVVFVLTSFWGPYQEYELSVSVRKTFGAAPRRRNCRPPAMH